MSRPAPSWPFAAALLGLTYVLGCFPAWDYDVWWQLRAGQLIAARGAVPRTDWFTFTNANAAWIDLQWGFQLALAGLHALGGVTLLVAAKALAGVSAVALSLAARRPDWPLELAVAAWFAPLVVLSGRLAERPETASLVFLAALLCLLFHAAERPRLLWAVPVLQAVWFNVHAFAAFGPAVLALYWADALARTALPRSGALVPPGGAGGAWLAPRALAGPTATTAVACFLNPYLARGAFFPLELLAKVSGGDGFYRATIGELQPVGDFLLKHGAGGSPYLAAWLATLALAFASFALLGAAHRRVSVFRLLAAVVFAWLGWQAKRNSALFALVLGTVTVWNLADAWSLARRPAWGRRSRTVLGVALAAALALVVTGTFYEWAGEGRTVGLGERPGWFAHDACKVLARPGMPERMLVYDLGQAAVCLYHAGPERKIFVDPRLEVNSRATLERYIEIEARLADGDRSWEQLLDGPRSALPSILVDRLASEAALAGLLRDPRWRPVYVDPLAVVFLTNEKADELGMPRVR